jgi:hypothetical protein
VNKHHEIIICQVNRLEKLRGEGNRPEGDEVLSNSCDLDDQSIFRHFRCQWWMTSQLTTTGTVAGYKKGESFMPADQFETSLTK